MRLSVSRSSLCLRVMSVITHKYAMSLSIDIWLWSRLRPHHRCRVLLQHRARPRILHDESLNLILLLFACATLFGIVRFSPFLFDARESTQSIVISTLVSQISFNSRLETMALFSQVKLNKEPLALCHGPLVFLSTTDCAAILSDLFNNRTLATFRPSLWTA